MREIKDDYDIKLIFEELELDLITKMKRTLWGHKSDEEAKGFDWPQWQTMKLKQLKDYREQNRELFNGYKEQVDRYTYPQMKKQFKEGAAKVNKEAIIAGKIKKEDSQLGGSFFGLNTRKLDALIKSTKQDMRDVKSATLRMSNDVYRSTIYKAQVFANSGAGTVKQAVDMATKDFLSRGYNCIQYKNGSRHNIADYCDMAIKTANKRANLMGEGEMRKELGNPFVYVSKHNGACEICQQWQDRVYIDDIWSGGKASDGPYPLLSVAVDAGFLHPRCQHGVTTYFPGITEIPDTMQEHKDDEKDTYNSYLQNQIKKYNRLSVGSLFPENIEKYTARREELKNELKDDTIELTKEEINQITEYTRFDATRINKAIRTDNITNEIQKKIDILDDAISKSKELNEDIILHRGTIIQSIVGFENRKVVSYEEIMNLSEKFIKDRAFISTSKLKAEELGRNIIMKIRVPKGFKGALDIEEYAVDKYKYQKEVLLKRNTKFYIKNIEFKDKKYYFDMEVIE